MFPHFAYDFLESKTPQLAYKQWKNTTYFVYNDKSTECPDCGYKKDVADKEGNLYWGQWSADGTKEGRGTMLFKYGDIYEGYWKDGKYEGKGRLIWHNGRKYLGRWRNGKMQGEGVLRYETGDIYEGYMVNGMRSGHGILTYANGDRYDGYWLLD